MSEVSVLAHEYKTASDFSQALNRALIALKRAALDLPGHESLAPTLLDASRQDVIGILEALLALIRPDRLRDHRLRPGRSVPVALVARLQEQRRGTLEYYVQDLERVISHLQVGIVELTPDDLALLDELAAAADSEASSVFRRMMRI